MDSQTDGVLAPEPAPMSSTVGAFKGLMRHTALYGLSSGAVQLVGVVTVPVFARELSPVSYGILELTLIVVALLATIVDAGIGSAAQRSFFDYSAGEYMQRRTVVATAFVATTAVAFVATVVVVAALGPVSEVLYGQSQRWILLLAALSIGPATIGQFCRNVMRLHSQPSRFALSSLLGAGVGAAASLVAAVVFHLGVRGIVGGLLVGYVLSAIYGLASTATDLRARPSRFELRRMIAFGLPLVPSGIALWLVWFIDRVMLARLSGLGDVGEYAIANRLTGLLLLAVLAFNLAFGPYILSLHAEDQQLERRVRAQTLLLAAAVLSLLGVALTLYARELISLVAPRYDRAHQVVGLLSLAIVIYGIYPVVSTGMTIARRTSFLGAISVAAAGVNIGLNVVLIPAWGMVGAAVATVGAFVVLSGGTAIAAQHIDRVAYPVGRLAVVVAAAIAASAAAFVSTGSEAADVAIKFACLAGFTAIAAFVVVSSSSAALAFFRR